MAPMLRSYDALMPWGLKRFQEARCLHFLTFSCLARAPLLGTARAREIFCGVDLQEPIEVDRAELVLVADWSE